MYKKILVPVDGSDTSVAALLQAAELARLTGASLRLLHVVETISSSGFETPEVFRTDVLPRLLGRGAELLRQAREQAGSGLTVETSLVEGHGERASHHIVEEIRSCGADLVVLGTHGRRGVQRVLLGSDAEQVARTSPVPVMLVRTQPTG